MRRRLVIALAASALSCSSTEGAAPAPAGPLDGGTGVAASGPLPCDVGAVLTRSCVSCHSDPPQFGAPMPLVTWTQAHAEASLIHARIHDDQRPMPPPPNARLDAASAATLDAWIAGGAPAGGDATCGASPAPGRGDDGGASLGDGAAPATDCVPDLHVAPASPYTMLTPETYVCYGFDAPSDTRQVIAIRPRIDDTRIVHHVLLLKSPVATSGVPIDCNPGPSLGEAMLYAWAPGGPPLVLPPEAGFPEDGTTHYVVQIHYNNAANAPNPTDASGFDLCTTTALRPYDADVVAFGTEAIALPPRAKTTLTSCFTAPAAMDGRHVFAAFPHMHKLGASITTGLVPDGGAPLDMGTDATWDFSNQPWLPIDATIHTGDVVRTQCTWNNTGDTLVTFGQGTADEMCYSFTAYYPVATPSLGWSAPATGSVACP
jgi:hypothetical protein